MSSVPPLHSPNRKTLASHLGGSGRMATLFLTNACNLKCPYCYAIENEFSPEERWTEQRIQKVLDVLSEKGFRLALGGGEPLTDLPLTLEAGRQAHLRGIPVSLLTNGYLLSRELLGGLLHAGFNWIQISADSSKELSGFESILAEGARLGLRMAVGTVLLPHRLGDLPVMLDILARSGASGWRILRYTPLNGSDYSQKAPTNEEWIRMLLALERIVRQGPCPVQIRYEPSVMPLAWWQALPDSKKPDICGGRRARRIFLYPDGAAYSCGLPRRKGIPLGNFESNLEEWKNLIDEVPEENCGNPSLDRKMGTYCREICRGGCLQMRDGRSCDPRCEIEKGLVPACCFEKLLVSKGKNDEGEIVYPSEVFASWLSS